MNVKSIAAFSIVTGALFASETRLQMKDLPEAVRKAVTEQAKGNKLRGLSKEVENGKTFYEAELTVNGKNRDVLLDPSGNVVEVEEAVPLASVPDAVQKTLKEQAGSGKVLTVETV